MTATAWLQGLRAGDVVAMEQRNTSWGPTYLVRATVIKVTPAQLVLQIRGCRVNSRAHKANGILLGGYHQALFPLTAEVEAAIRDREDRNRLRGALLHFKVDSASIETVRAILPYLTVDSVEPEQPRG